MKKEKLLREFIEWAESCGGDSFYIFDEPEEAIKLFLKQRKVRESDPGDDHIKYEEDIKRKIKN